MATLAPSEAQYTVERYFRLVDEGILGPDDRVELLEGVIVAMAPHSPAHATGITCAAEALRDAVGKRATIRIQLTFIAGRHSAPEPDIAVVPGRVSDYRAVHPATALLLVEVADSSLAQDRVTKAALYAGAGVLEYWIVNLRNDRIEIFRSPERESRRWRETRIAHHGERLSLVAFPDVTVAVDDLLPVH
ncbi:MAG: Uma2 family endonuclease [Deltaproteobacteria bacterium]|nr:Uma2 family endonuclease [Deltaproteobacteria bacterium]